MANGKEIDPIEYSKKTLRQSAEIVGSLLPKGPFELIKEYLKRAAFQKSLSMYRRLRNK